VKRMSWIKRLLTLSLVIGMAQGCGDSRTAGGGIETTNGGIAITGRLLLASGEPAVGAKVVALLSNGVADTIMDTVRTDGSYRLVLPRKGHWAVLGRAPGLAVVGHLLADSLSSRILQDTLRPVRDISISLRCGGKACAGVVDMPWLGVRQNIAATGGVLRDLPTSPIWITASAGVGFSFDGVFTADTVSDTLALELSDSHRVLLDDFDGDSRHHRATLLPLQEGLWTVNPDVGIDDQDVFPSCLLNLDGACWSDSSAWKGRSLHAGFHSDTTGYRLRLRVDLQGGAYASDTSRRWINGAELDSLTFWAKGEGQVRLDIVTQERLESGKGLHYGFTFGLSGTWTHVRIARGSIDIADVGAPRWTTLDARIAALEFVIPENTDFWMDGLELHGIGFGDLQ